MVNQNTTLLAMLACSPVPPAAGAQPRLRAAHGPVAGAATATVYASHSQKRFAMAGIDTNVWPLSPQGWMSG